MNESRYETKPLPDGPQASVQELTDAISPEVSDLVDEPQASGPRLNIDPEDVGKGLGQLVLTVVRLLHELLEKQAIRRMEGGLLTEEEADRLGQTLYLQAQEIEKLAEHFGTTTKDLNLDLGPLGKLL